MLFVPGRPLAPRILRERGDAGGPNDGHSLANVGFFALDPANPTGPNGLPWTASCGSAHLTGSRLCFARYNLIDGLSIGYKFGLTGFDVDRMREVDLAVRQRVLDLRVPQYDGKDLR